MIEPQDLTPDRVERATPHVTVEFYDRLNARVVNLSQGLTAKELSDYFSRVYEAGPSLFVVWHVMYRALDFMSIDELKASVTEHVSLLEQRTGGRSYCVVENSNESIIAKWFVAFTGSLDGLPVKFELRESVDEGAW